MKQNRKYVIANNTRYYYESRNEINNSMLAWFLISCGDIADVGSVINALHRRCNKIFPDHIVSSVKMNRLWNINKFEVNIRFFNPKNEEDFVW